jgi:hypothetical protein
MRAVLATAVAALAVATPAGAITMPDGSVSLHAATGTTQNAKDKTRTCQAGSKKKVILKSRHPAVIACEQPPRANLLGPGSLAKATAAALSVIG